MFVAEISFILLIPKLYLSQLTLLYESPELFLKENKTMNLIKKWIYLTKIHTWRVIPVKTQSKFTI